MIKYDVCFLKSQNRSYSFCNCLILFHKLLLVEIQRIKENKSEVVTEIKGNSL